MVTTTLLSGYFPVKCETVESSLILSLTGMLGKAIVGSVDISFILDAEPVEKEF